MDYIPRMALLSAMQTGSRCTAASWYPTGLFHGSEYASRLNASCPDTYTVHAAHMSHDIWSMRLATEN